MIYRREREIDVLSTQYPITYDDENDDDFYDVDGVEYVDVR